MLKRVFYWNRPIFKRLVPLNIKKLDLAIASARHFAMSDCRFCLIQLNRKRQQRHLASLKKPKNSK